MRARPDDGDRSAPIIVDQGRDLVASVCHDLKQNIATGMLLSDEVAGEDLSETVRRRFKILRDQFEHAASLVALLSDDPAEEPPEPSAVDLSRVSADTVEAAGVGHRIRLQVEGVGHVVQVDPVLLRRAVTNLVDNACRASTAAGEVQVRVGGGPGGSWVEVADDGPGFGRIEAGTGHGLPVVMAALSACDGQLRIGDSGDRGTVVRMLFPARRAG